VLHCHHYPTLYTQLAEDCGMLDGFGFLEELKQDSSLPHPPVMILTSEVQRTEAIRAIKAGAVNYLCKPFQSEELAAKITESLGLAAQ
jgi:DNA-binding response OmpR family regulator